MLPIVVRVYNFLEKNETNVVFHDAKKNDEKNNNAIR